MEGAFYKSGYCPGLTPRRRLVVSLGAFAKMADSYYSDASDRLKWMPAGLGKKST
ncbi:MAG: hypothetical protein PHX05_03065 [Acidobacteriota bacterium]|nr:hypothetical protein [Acidobacteriota bacterium]